MEGLAAFVTRDGHELNNRPTFSMARFMVHLPGLCDLVSHRPPMDCDFFRQSIWSVGVVHASEFRKHLDDF